MKSCHFDASFDIITFAWSPKNVDVVGQHDSPFVELELNSHFALI